MGNDDLKTEIINLKKQVNSLVKITSELNETNKVLIMGLEDLANKINN